MRIALGIEYNGHGFHGWQAQRDTVTVEGTLQEALSKVANEPIQLFCAGRTDAGVHAIGQVIHFDTRAKRHIDAWIWGTNSYLPPSVSVRWARAVDFSFHARFTATARRYRYVIHNCPVRPALLSARATWHYYPLDIDRMRQAAMHLLGEQDFSSFRASQCNSKSPKRNLTELSIERRQDFIILDVEANAFLQHMVRNIAGSLMKVGAGFREPDWIKEVLEAKSRQVAAETAAPDGLYLTRVYYPEPYTFPKTDQLIIL